MVPGEISVRPSPVAPLAAAFRAAFDVYIDTFLQRRRELDAFDASDEEVRKLDEEYRRLHRDVVSAYRAVREHYRRFLRDEPRYDLRGRYDDGLGGFMPVLDHPLTDWWEPLTFERALWKWANADDAHLGPLLREQRAFDQGTSSG